jgi:hypothetical protein
VKTRDRHGKLAVTVIDLSVVFGVFSAAALLIYWVTRSMSW